MGKELLEQEKDSLFFPNKDMNDIIRNVKSIAFLIDGATETLKHEINSKVTLFLF